MAESICLKCEHKRYCIQGIDQPRENSYMTGCSRFAEKKPVKNADRIRAYSDEELAEWLTERGECEGLPMFCDDHDGNCPRCWLDWLQQEVET